MARSLNKVMFIGHLGDAPEIRYMPTGEPVATVSLATTRTWKDKRNNGALKEDTQWHRLVAFKRLAEIMGEYALKGAKVYVEGSLRHRKYESNGVDKWITEVVLSDFQLLDRRPASGTEKEQAETPTGRAAPTVAQRANDFERDADLIPRGEDVPPLDGFDDDIPF